MDLMLNDLLQLTDDETANSRIELNMTAEPAVSRVQIRHVPIKHALVERPLSLTIGKNQNDRHPVVLI